VLAKEKFGLRGREMTELKAAFIPFTAQTRMSGVDFHAQDGQDSRSIRKGAADAVKQHVTETGGRVANEINVIVDGIARSGGTPLVVAENAEILGVIELKDIVKGGMKERFAQLRAMLCPTAGHGYPDGHDYRG